MTEAYKGLIIKILIGILSAAASALHVTMGAGDTAAIAADGADLAMVAYSVWRTNGMKLVPHASIAIPLHASDTPIVNQPVVDSHVIIGGQAVRVVGALLFCILMLPYSAHATTPAPVGACNIATLFVGVTPTNFLTKLSACGNADFQGAIDDANTAPIDNLALSCLNPAFIVVKAVNDSAGGTTGLVTAFQKFRRAQQSGVIANCISYVNNTVNPLAH